MTFSSYASFRAYTPKESEGELSTNNSLVGKCALITGGAGFIGSHLAEALVSKKNEVIVLDNLSSGRLSNLPSNRLIQFVRGDIRDFQLVDSLVKRSDIVFHLAEFIPDTKTYGFGHIVKFSTENPLLDFDVSARGTLIVLKTANKYTKKTGFRINCGRLW